MHRIGPPRSFLAVVLWMAIGTLSGCVHLNIPSVRLGEEPGFFSSHIDGHPMGLPGEDFAGGPPCDMENGSWQAPAAADAPESPEVPWPRFHPLPTRPVLQ